MKRPSTQKQRRIGKLLKIDVVKDSEAIASAKIREQVADAICQPKMAHPSSEKQRIFGKSIGINVDSKTLIVASAMIDETLYKRNENALAWLKLKIGDKVRKRSLFDKDTEKQVANIEAVVSSIGLNLRVYFKGGGGQGAWPSEIELISRNGK